MPGNPDPVNGVFQESDLNTILQYVQQHMKVINIARCGTQNYILETLCSYQQTKICFG